MKKAATERPSLLSVFKVIGRYCDERGAPPPEPFVPPIRDPNAPRRKWKLSETGKRIRRELDKQRRNAGR